MREARLGMCSWRAGSAMDRRCRDGKALLESRGGCRKNMHSGSVHRRKKLKTSLSLRFYILKNRFKFTPLHRITKYQRNARTHHHAVRY